MNNQDENAWVREFEKVEREQKQRVVVEFGDITQQKACSLIEAIKAYEAKKGVRNEID